jgi:hypothetical protein
LKKWKEDKEMRESFIFYKSFYESIKELDPLDQVQIYNAIYEYEFYKIIPELTGVCKSIFTLILPQLEANDKKYENGKKGGRPRNQNETKMKPKQNQNETKIKPNVNDNVNVNDNNNKKNIKRKIYFENEELNKLFLEYLELRTKIKCKNTDRAINLLLNELNKYDDDIKIQMINNSIMNSWKSVYPVKNAKTNEIKPEWLDKKYVIERNEEAEDVERRFLESIEES